jgi:hypothetical protein
VEELHYFKPGPEGPVWHKESGLGPLANFPEVAMASLLSASSFLR